MPGFVPECGNVAPELTLHILTTDTGIVRCLHHSMNRSVAKVQNDLTASPREWSLTGTPYETDSARVVSLAGGLLTCGCQIENSLLDFYLFKTGRLWSPTKLQTEDWRSQRVHPRVRELVLTQIKSETLWNLDNIWCYTMAADTGEFTVFIPESKRLRIMLERQTQRLAEIEEREKQAATKAARDEEEHERKVGEELEAIMEEAKRGQQEWEAKLAEKAESERKRQEKQQRKEEKEAMKDSKPRRKVQNKTSDNDKSMGKEK